VRGRNALGRKPLPFGGVDHAIVDEAGQRLLVELLKLASAALAKMAARRNGMMRPRQQGPVRPDGVSRRGERHVAARRGDAIAPGGDADYLFGFVHSAAA
jgi:hypothetical protein